MHSLAKPPVTVFLAVCLHTASYTLGFVRMFVATGFRHPAITYVTWLLVVAIVFVYLKALYKGRNWVRWLSVVLATIGVLYMSRAFELLVTPWARYTYFVQAILVSAAAILVLLPASNKWYRPNHSPKPTQLRDAV